MTATRKWTALTVLVIGAVFVASWFLLIGPKRSEAAALRSDKVAQDATNERLRQQLEVLKAQAQDLPKQEAFLAQIRRQVPDNPALPTLIRSLSSAAKKSGVELVSLAPAAPVAVVSTTAVAPVPTSTAPAGGATAPPAGQAAPPAAAPTLYRVPIVVKTSGDYFEMAQFVNKLEGLKRSFLVNGFTLANAPADAESGTAEGGSLSLEVRGSVFLSPAAAAAVAAPGLASAPAVTPTPTAAPAAN